MEKSALTNITEKLTQAEKNFVSDLKHLAGEARRQAYRSADHLLVARNWLIGWRIVTQEQNGKERAKYGKHVIELASQTLTEEYGRGIRTDKHKEHALFLPDVQQITNWPSNA